MTIKHIPVCPFCRKDMKLLGDVQLPRKLALIHQAEHVGSTHYNMEGVVEYESVKMYTCECGFVALWKWEL